MKSFPLVLLIGLTLLAGAVAGWFYTEAGRANTVLHRMSQVPQHAPMEEVRRILGEPSYTFDAPSLPAWVVQSPLGEVKDGTVLVYTLPHTYLLIIHVLPATGVQFVTWAPT